MIVVLKTISKLYFKLTRTQYIMSNLFVVIPWTLANSTFVSWFYDKNITECRTSKIYWVIIQYICTYMELERWLSS